MADVSGGEGFCEAEAGRDVVQPSKHIGGVLMIDPFDGRAEMTAAELNAWIAAGSPETFIPPIEPPKIETEEAALAFWIGTKAKQGFAQRHGGIGRHIRKAKGQNVAGIADCLMWVRTADGTAVRVVIEIKVGRDSLSGVQREVLDWERESGSLVLVVRYDGAVRPGEVSHDEAVRLIEEALAA